MSDPRRFYWLKLKEDFFRQKEIKKLRKVAGGDVFTIIYLKMLLRAMKDSGKLYYEGVEDDFASELALDIDEDEDNVKMTVAFLMANGILVQNSVDEYELMTMDEMTGSECESAHRVRKLRAQKALQCNAEVTPSNAAVTTGNIEIENRDRERDRDKSKRDTAQRFIPPTLSEVEAYANEKGYMSREFSPSGFVDFYQSKGWKVGKDKMTDWKAAARGWVSRYRKDHPAPEPDPKPDPNVYTGYGLMTAEQQRRYDEMTRQEQIAEGLLKV